MPIDATLARQRHRHRCRHRCRTREVTVFAEPGGGDYHRSAAVMIGEQLAVPVPLMGVLDTREFR